MKFLEYFSVAARSLMANKLRSSLTMLGIIIGVMSVISLMSLGEGAQASITSQFEELGANLVYVSPTNPDAPGGDGLMGMTYGMMVATLSLEDAEAIANPYLIRGVVGVTPVNENFVELVAGNNSTTALIHGTTADYEWIMGYPVATGQFITDRHVASSDMVVVIGSTVAEDLFGDADPIGQRVRIKGKRFTVIGVLEEKGGQMMGVGMDDIVQVPITTYQARLFTQNTISGEDAVQSIAVAVGDPDDVDMVMEEITELLRRRHHITDEKDDFSVYSQGQLLGIFEEIIGIFTVFLGAIAGISLLVGSIGIMNIMLVSVTERTREIGIRKAVGAKRRDILTQFLLEAAMLSLIGGGIGILVGMGMSALISIGSGGQIHSVLSADIIILAVSVSVFIGLASGVYPARRAARLDPIEALRYG